MKKYIFNLFFFFNLLSHNTFCMLSKLKYPAYEQPDDPIIIAARIALDKEVILLEDFAKHSVKICRLPTSKEYLSDIRCSIYATKKITGLIFDCFSANKDDSWNMGIQTLFKQLPAPKKGCLVVWITNENELLIRHFGYLISDPNKVKNWKDLIVKHKVGDGPVVESPLFNVPEYYGSGALFFDLRKKYTSKSSLLELQKNINLKRELPESDQLPKQKQTNILYSSVIISSGIIFGYLYGGSEVITGIIFGYILSSLLIDTE